MKVVLKRACIAFMWIITSSVLYADSYFISSSIINIIIDSIFRHMDQDEVSQGPVIALWTCTFSCEQWYSILYGPASLSSKGIRMHEQVEETLTNRIFSYFSFIGSLNRAQGAMLVVHKYIICSYFLYDLLYPSQIYSLIPFHNILLLL